MYKNINGIREPVLDYFYTYPEKFGPLLFTIPFNKLFRKKQLNKIQENFIFLYDWMCDGNVWDCQNELEIITREFTKEQSKKYMKYLQLENHDLKYLSKGDEFHNFKFPLTKQQIFYAIGLLNKPQLQKLCTIYIKDNSELEEIKHIYFELYGKKIKIYKNKWKYKKNC